MLNQEHAYSTSTNQFFFCEKKPLGVGRERITGDSNTNILDPGTMGKWICARKTYAQLASRLEPSRLSLSLLLPCSLYGVHSN